MRGFLRRLCKDATHADDLAQDTFLQAYRKLGSFEGQGRFASWLLGIAYRCFLQAARREHRREEVTARWAEESLGHTEDTHSAALLDLERAMSCLSETEAAAITLNMSLGFSHAEVSRIMALPLGTIKSHIARGIEKLRRHMADTAQEIPS